MPSGVQVEEGVLRERPRQLLSGQGGGRLCRLCGCDAEQHQVPNLGPLGAILRPGNAGSNTAADHLALLDRALTQLPDRWRSHPVLVRADGAGYSHALINGLSVQGLEFSVGYPVTEAVRTAIGKMPGWAWQVACNADGDLREHADVVEISDLLNLSRWTKTCPDMRVIVRRELPHPGATLDALPDP